MIAARQEPLARSSSERTTGFEPAILRRIHVGKQTLLHGEEAILEMRDDRILPESR
jgi:hypothetical protein